MEVSLPPSRIPCLHFTRLLTAFRRHCRVNACDREDKFEALKGDYEGEEAVLFVGGTRLTYLEIPHTTIHRNGHLVSRVSDYIIYCVEAENIEAVVACYGPC